MNAPKLRFKEFTDEWIAIKLNDISKTFDYGMNVASTSFDGKNKYIRITDIDDVSHKFLKNNIVSPSGSLEDKYLVKMMIFYLLEQVPLQEKPIYIILMMVFYILLDF